MFWKCKLYWQVTKTIKMNTHRTLKSALKKFIRLITTIFAILMTSSDNNSAFNVFKPLLLILKKHVRKLLVLIFKDPVLRDNYFMLLVLAFWNNTFNLWSLAFKLLFCTLIWPIHWLVWKLPQDIWLVYLWLLNFPCFEFGYLAPYSAIERYQHQNAGTSKF